MPIKDVFLPLVGEPRGPAPAAIEKCVTVAAELGARINALALEEEVFERPKLMLPYDRDSAESSSSREANDNAFAPERDRLGWCEKDRHWPATMLGYDFRTRPVIFRPDYNHRN